MAVRIYIEEVKVQREDPEPWMEQASCRQAESADIFFENHLGDALKYCRKCPVQLECLAYALRVEPQGRRYGIVGGKTAGQRDDLARRLKEMRKS